MDSLSANFIALYLSLLVPTRWEQALTRVPIVRWAVAFVIAIGVYGILSSSFTPLDIGQVERLFWTKGWSLIPSVGLSLAAYDLLRFFRRGVNAGGLLALLVTVWGFVYFPAFVVLMREVELVTASIVYQTLLLTALISLILIGLIFRAIIYGNDLLVFLAGVGTCVALVLRGEVGEAGTVRFWAIWGGAIAVVVCALSALVLTAIRPAPVKR